MSKTLKMTFTLDDSKAYTCSLLNPKDGLTKAEVEAVMQSVIDKEAFVVNGAKPAAIKEAVIRETSETALA